MRAAIALCVAIFAGAVWAAEKPAAPGAERDFIEGADMSAREARPYRMHVLSHTHWDREWYQDFQGYRRRLVYLTDALLDLSTSGSRFGAFTSTGRRACWSITSR